MDLTTKYRRHTPAMITYALADIKETLAIWRDTDTDYTRQLWAEWDHLIAMKQAL